MMSSDSVCPSTGEINDDDDDERAVLDAPHRRGTASRHALSEYSLFQVPTGEHGRRNQRDGDASMER